MSDDGLDNFHVFSVHLIASVNCWVSVDVVIASYFAAYVHFALCITLRFVNDLPSRVKDKNVRGVQFSASFECW